MRRILANALGVAAVPIGVGVGLWTALLTFLPNCPVRGLGTLDLCAARPTFDQRFSVLFGTGAAVVVLLVSIIVRHGSPKAAVFDLGAASAGILIGLWTSTMMMYPPCGPHQLCLGYFFEQRFAVWQSVCLGAATTAVILLIVAAVSTEFRRVNLEAARRIKRWLFVDLSNVIPVDRPRSPLD
ncbi:MAG: hypothetical protein ACHQ4F_08595 [Candidatus Dormibacteria bacterium]